MIEQLGIEKFPAGCLHGAVIYDNEGNVEQAMSLEPKFVKGVTELMRKHNKTTMLYVHDWVAMASLEQGGKTDWEAVSRGFDPCVKDERETDFMQKVLAGEEQIGKVSLIGNSPRFFLFQVHPADVCPGPQIFLPMDEEVVPEFLELLRSTFPDTPFKTTRALPYIIEIVAEGVDKSVALSYFCGKFNIKPENVITFGDGENDVGMFNASGYSVHMGNAMQAPRDAAKYSTGTNNEGGVGQFLDRVFRVSDNRAYGAIKPVPSP